MERLLGPEGALHRRASTEIRLRPFDLPTVAGLFPELTSTAVLELQAAAGGWPLHLAAWDPASDAWDNLLRLAGRPAGLLLESAESLLRELPATGGFRQVLEAVGAGRTRRSRISDDAAQRVDHPLDVLTRGAFIRKSTSVAAPARAEPLYDIPDPYLRFWFSVIGPHAERIQGQGVVGLAG